MEFAFKIRQESGYLHCVLTGLIAGPEVPAVLQRVKREAEAAGCENVLLDLTEAFARQAMMDRFSMGVQAAEVWGDKLRVAIVFRPTEITKFFENVAVSRGARVCVLPSKPAALRWLLDQPPPTA
jgi:hypothetical protein